ncbi:hypothetical protein BH23CHL8_BH23CHL8_09950 [soil metagenome]
MGVLGLPAHSTLIQQRGVVPIRRLLLSVPAVVIIAALLVGSAPVEASIRKVALGVSIEHHSRERQTYLDFASDVGGNKPRLWTLWSTWGSRGGETDCLQGKGTCYFPRAAADWVAAEGATPFIFWEPFKAFDSCEYATHKWIAAGRYDGYIRTWAKEAKQYGKRVLVRYAHEINAAFFPWTTRHPLCGNTVKDFKQGWKHVVGIFRKVGATNVRFVWTVAKKTCATKGCNPYKAFYPGDKWVDFAGFSSFNWGAQKNNWVSMENGVSGIMKKFKDFTRKPIIIAELATNTYTGSSAPPGASKPQWIREGYPTVYKKHPQIKAIIYLNVDLSGIGHPDWSLNTPGTQSHAAYAEIASQKRFKGRIR